MTSLTPQVLKPRVLCAPELSKFRKTVFVVEFTHSDRLGTIFTNLLFMLQMLQKSLDLVKVWVPHTYNLLAQEFYV
jgi:hypothetical protein